MKRITREALVRSVDFDKRTVSLVASTDQLCPDNMIILSRAWARDYEAWLRGNPVVLGFHDYRSWAVGHVSEGKIEDGRLVETISFDDVNPEAIVAWSLYSKGHQRAASVGWESLEFDSDLPIGEVIARYGDDLSPETMAQLKAEGEANSDRKATVVTRAKKLETSLVPVGMDDQAVTAHGLFGSRCDDISPLLQAAERFGVRFVDGRGERPGWEDTNSDDSKVGQIRYRVKEPGLFDQSTFKTKPLDVKGEGDVQFILGKLKEPPEGAEGSMVTQSVHFNKGDGWTMDAAKEWWKEHEEKQKKSIEYAAMILKIGIEGIETLRADALELGIELEETLGEHRIGKVLSAKNKTAIEETVSAMQGAITLLKNVLTLAEGQPEEKGSETDELRTRAERVLADAEFRRKLKAICGGT